MKFAFASLLVVAAALLPAAQASMDITFTADKFARRAEEAAPVAVKPPRNPEFGIFLNNRYLLHNGEGLPKPKDVKETYPECKWRKYGQWAWLDENNVQCYLGPSYKYHAYSPAKNFDPVPSIQRGACADTANPQDFPQGIPRYTISVPYLYFNNFYDRRCKVRALVKVPQTDKEKEHWIQAWVVEHNGGNWSTKSGDLGPNGPQEGIMLDTKLYPKFLNSGDKDIGVLPNKVEWFFLDINTIG
ncbi:hypothetical protein NDA11_004342 [Ustilago hordei]|uniref:Uncharacterized protein n=1 Tax=Ustilago hordei TaxID=120017 RepID=I2G262_USTHO|nr:uncharacterized protein UHO2_02587 [Ustilago hordei]KAJ1040261.1 hypothetical protein NDA10_003604 [Ustilago hordei]KAJ1585532.1 hypothetical protein NDA15_007107 [Ustilago hordei]KAJ1587940.1 hypothetical protein NDA12_002193 [Ustilago hordei]KAJ1593035.1 hypothetical protein NDA11_004342 [Ustilago hordei]KAJ1601863.1 hypothetical protein NDA14_007147 [Ustilago hordei]